MSGVALGFSMAPLMLPLDRILASRKTPMGLLTSRKYQQIRSSIEEIGLIEPLSVHAMAEPDEPYMLLDGHIRLIVLRELKHEVAPCLVATDDEAYTYNARLNRLSSIQEHFMILRAIKGGLAPERLAKVLSVDVSQIFKKAKLLNGICPEAAAMLDDWKFSAEVTTVLRKMKPTRQVESVELMTSANKVTVTYAKALLVATPSNLLVDGAKPKKLHGVAPEQMARMEREMGNLQTQYRLAEQTYGEDVLNMVTTRGYLTRLLGNPRVNRFLKERQPDLLDQLTTIIQATALDG